MLYKKSDQFKCHEVLFSIFTLIRISGYLFTFSPSLAYVSQFLMRLQLIKTEALYIECFIK